MRLSVPGMDAGYDASLYFVGYSLETGEYTLYQNMPLIYTTD